MNPRSRWFTPVILGGLIAACGAEDRPQAAFSETRVSGQVVGPGSAGFPSGRDIIGPLPAAEAPVPVTGALVRVSLGGVGVAEDFALSGGRFLLTVAEPGPGGPAVHYARMAATDGTPWAAAATAELRPAVENRLAAPLALTAAATAWGVFDGPVDLIAAPDLGRAVRPEADGYWALGELPPGVIRLAAHRSGHPPVVVETEMTAGRAQEVSFPAFGSALDPAMLAEIGGQVADAESGFVVAGALVEAGGALALSGEDGRFVLLAPGGDLIVRAAADGYLPSTRVLAAPPGQSRTANLDLPRSRNFGQAGLHGRVVDAWTGRPVTGAVVTAVGRGAATRADAAGDFSLALSAGCVAVSAFAEGYGRATRIVCTAPGRALQGGRWALPAAGGQCVADRERCGDETDNDCDALIDEGCDRIPPAAVDLSKVVLTMARPGLSDTIEGLPGAAEPGAQVIISAAGVIVQERARLRVAADGSFPLVDLGSNLVTSLKLVVIDDAGNSSPPVFLVNDVEGPRTTIEAGPSTISRSGVATFTWVASEPVTTSVCRLDRGIWSPCESPWEVSGLSFGAHEFQVRTTDVAGNPEFGDGDAWAWTVEPMITVSSLGGPPVAPPVLVPTGAGGLDLVLVLRPDGKVERRGGAGRGATVRWTTELTAAADSQDAPLVVDLDGDGTLDVLVAADHAYIGLDGASGKRLASWPVTAINSFGNPVPESPCAAVVQAWFAADGVTSWVGLARSGSGKGDYRVLHRYRADVTLPVATVAVSAETPSLLNGNPAAVDLDSDGMADVVVADADRLMAFRGDDLAPLWTTGPIDSGNAQRVDPVVVDFGDGQGPIILQRFGDRRVVAVRGSDGWKLWDQTVGESGNLSPGFVVGDLGRDGDLELIAVVDDRVEIRPLSPPSGLSEPTTILLDDYGIGGIAQAPLLADVDGDGKAEIILLEFRTRAARLWAFAADGTFVWRVTLPAEALHSPVAGDIDGDGAIEVAVATGTASDGQLVVVSTSGDAAAAAALPWPEPQQTAIARTLAVDPGEPDDEVTAATRLGELGTLLRTRKLAENGGVDYFELSVTEAGQAYVRFSDVPATASLRLHVWKITGGVPVPVGSVDSGGNGEGYVDGAVGKGDRLRIGVEILSLSGGYAAPYAVEVTRTP